MEVIRSSETSVQFIRSTRRHIPEDGILHSKEVDYSTNSPHTIANKRIIRARWRVTCILVRFSTGTPTVLIDVFLLFPQSVLENAEIGP
jgi:hypothetical protein